MKKLILIFFFISSCMVGPKVKSPEISHPLEYSYGSKEIQKKANLDSFWKSFEDEYLNEIIDIAIVNNYEIKIALEKIEEAKYFYKVEKANLFPQIDLNAKVIRERISQNVFGSTFSGPAIQNFFQVGFDAIWEVDIFGKLRRKKQIAFFDILKSQDSSKEVYLTLLSEVIRTYIDTLVLNKLVYLKEKKISFQKKIYKLSEDKLVSGLLNEIDLDQTFITLNQDKIDLINQKTDLKKNIFHLAVLLGKYPEDFEKNFNYTKEIPLAKPIKDVGLPSDLLKRRPDIAKAEKELFIAIANIGVSIADLFPSFSLLADFNYKSSKSSSWFNWASRAWSIGPNINLPLIDFGKRLSTVKVNRSVHRQALLNYKNVIIKAFEDVEGSFVSYFHEQDNFLLRNKKLSSQKDITSLEKDLYVSGLKSKIDYLQSEIDLIQMEEEFIKNLRSVNISYISLIKALGGGIEDKCLK